jgi:hypothetical protein
MSVMLHLQPPPAPTAPTAPRIRLPWKNRHVRRYDALFHVL